MQMAVNLPESDVVPRCRGLRWAQGEAEMRTAARGNDAAAFTAAAGVSKMRNAERAMR
jgi:hypothetical protein